MKYDSAEDLITKWGKRHPGRVLEIHVVGSLAKRSNETVATKKSDLDLMVFISDSVEQEFFYQELAAIGLETGVLIHPLFVCESEKSSKLSMTLYSDALKNGRRLL